MATKRALPLILALLLAAVFTGCPAQPPAAGSETAKVTVVVTRDFGQELILAKEIEINEGTDAMTALQTVAEVETKYGGGFVQAITVGGSEYESDDKSHLDWFYYINGVSLSLGAKDYSLGGGDVEQWDLRDWSYLQFVPAIIGAFPQPFLSGVRGEAKPTAVVYDAPFAEEAGALAAKLAKRGAAGVTLNSAETLADGVKSSGNLIIVGSADNGLILELNELHKKLGFFAYIEGGKIIVLDDRGAKSGEHGAGWGLIQATQNPWSPGGVGSGESAVFIVTGSDENGIRNAAKALIDNSDGLGYACAALVNNSDIIKIP
jgi:hypothetical protein